MPLPLHHTTTVPNEDNDVLPSERSRLLPDDDEEEAVLTYPNCSVPNMLVTVARRGGGRLSLVVLLLFSIAAAVLSVFVGGPTGDTVGQDALGKNEATTVLYLGRYTEEAMTSNILNVELWEDWKANLQLGAEKAWNATANNAEKGWDATVNNAEKGWDATVDNTEKVWDATANNAEKVRDATEHEAEKVWSNTVNDAEKLRDATGKKFNKAAWKEAVSTEIYKAENALNNTVQSVEDSSQHWFENAWNASVEAAHNVWSGLGDEWTVVNEKEHIWWNKTVHNEQEWFNHTLIHLHTFGRRVQSWWNHGMSNVGKEEQVLQENFQQWWNNTNAKERQWWNDTLQASQRFERVADEKLHLWWNITESTASREWNQTVQEERRWWNAAQLWFHDHRANSGTANQPLLYLNSTEAYSYLMNGYGWYDYSADFFHYQAGLDVQINQAYCAVASSAALLNSLRPFILDDLPIDPIYAPHPYATQTSLLRRNKCVNRNVIRYNDTWDGIFHAPGGLSLGQASQLLKCHLPPTWKVTAHQVDPSNAASFDIRRALGQALKDPASRVIINYDRAVLGQEGHGHFSPLASYSEREDAFLIMDVAKYKYPPVWVPTGRLVAAMGSVDTCGTWNYPQGQDDVDIDFKSHVTEDMYQQALVELKCQQTFRGYIIVSLDSEVG
jgi:hypothetical protein